MQGRAYRLLGAVRHWLSLKLAARRYVFACLIAVLTAFTTYGVVFAVPSGDIVGVPARDCKAQGESWVGAAYASGQPEAAAKDAADRFHYGNAAVWQSGSGALQCNGFDIPDDERMERLALSFSMAVGKPGDAPAQDTATFDSAATNVFPVAQRTELVQPQSQSSAPSMDGLVRALVSQDGKNWEQVHVFNGSEQSNSLNDGFFSVALPTRLVRHANELQVKLEGLQAGDIQRSVYIDSVFLTYEAAPTRQLSLQSQNEASVSDGTPVFTQDAPVSFRLESKVDEGGIGSIASNVGGFLGIASEPDLKLAATVKNVHTGEISEVQPAVSWKGGAWVVDARQPAAITPGLYTLSIEAKDPDGNVQSAQQDFLWGVLALNTHKSIYQAGDTVNFDMAVLDERGMMTCDADVTLKIEGPSSAVLSTDSGDIKISDECRDLKVTKHPDYTASWQVPERSLGTHRGEYNLTLTATTANGTYSITDSFKVGPEQSVLVERHGHTRIMPQHTYRMAFDVTPQRDFSGTITETVPASFGLSNHSSVHATDEEALMEAQTEVTKNESAGTQQLTWQVDLEKGKTYRFSYDYDAPDISPEFYTLGPLTIEGNGLSFTEPRSWQIASDAMPTSVQRFTVSMGANAQVDTNLTTAVDPDHSFIIAQSRSASDTSATSTKVAASFINGGTAVRLQRQGTVSSVTVQLQVVTMPSITVEHGTIDTSSLGTGISSFNQSITDVGNTNKAFAIITNFGTGTAANYMRQQWAASLTSTTNLNVARDATGNTSTINYQIVKFIDGTTVEHDTISIAATATSGTAAISSVSIADSFLWGSWRSGSARTDVSPSWEFDSATQISATRAGITGATTVELMTIALPASAITQRTSISDISTTTNGVISAVADTDKTFTFVSNRHTGTTAVFDQMIATTHLSSTTNVQVRVGDAAGTAVGRAQTVELPIFVIPDAPVLYPDDGGSNQVAFNNIRQNSTTPTFRASATNSTNFDHFQIELNTVPDFSGTSYTQTFSGTYTSGTQYNLAANGLSPSLPTTDGVTYNVRVRASADSGTLWSDWSSSTWTYTYKSASETPDWFQTTDAQFNTGTLTDTQTTGSGSVEIAGGGGTPFNVGHTTPGGSTYNGLSGEYAAQKFTTASDQSGDLTSISIHVGSVDGTNPGGRVALYTDSSDQPGTLVAGSGSQTLTANSWNTFSLSGSVNASTTYWIAASFQGSTAFTYQFEGGSAVKSTFHSLSFGDPWPNTSVAPYANSNDENWSMYMTVTPRGGAAAVRAFDGVNDVINLAPGSTASIEGGPITVAAWVKPDSNTQDLGLLEGRNSSNPQVFSVYLAGDGKIYGGTGNFGGFSSFTDGQWQMMAYSKPSGNGSTVRVHLYNPATQTWTHGNGGTGDDESTPVIEVRLGEAFGSFFRGLVAVAGVWPSELSDGAIEAAGLETALVNWTAAGAAAAWPLNQANVGDGVTDATGNGANETSVTGTTVVTNDAPAGFSFGGANSGTIMSPVIDFDYVPGQASWGQVAWSEDETNGSISTQLYYTDSTTCDTVVPNAALSGNESGFTSGPVDISGLNTTTYNEICLRATLTDSGGSPFLEEWTVIWNDVDVPEAPTLYNDDGGSNQIAFNNIRQNSTAPTFRASATNTSSFDRFQIELNTAPDFSGTSYTQTFSSTYTSGTQYNLSASNLSPSLPTTNNATYYVRARASADSGSNWGIWSSGTWTYTYKSASETADWFQTTDEQFETGTLTDTQVSGPGSVELATGGLSAVERTSSAGSFNNTSNANSQAGISVPADAEIMVVGVSGYSSTNSFFSGGSMTIGGQSMSLASSSDSSSCCQMSALWYRAAPPTGTQTLAWDWAGSSGSGEGVTFWYAFYKGVDTADPIRSSDAAGGSSSASASIGPMTVQTGDAAVAASGGNGGSASWDGATELGDTLFNSNVASFAEAFPAGNISITVHVDSWSTLSGAVLRAGAGSAASGTITSSSIDYDWVPSAGSWGEFGWSEDETNGSISTQLYYTDSTTCDTVVPNAALSGNESGFTSGPVDISGLNTTTYNEICLRATLTDSGGTPFLQDWTVTWESGNAPPNDPASLTQAKTDDTNLPADSWTNETSIKLGATVTDSDGGETIRICAEVQPLGTPFTNPAGDGDGCSTTAVASGNTAAVTISGLSDNEEYHWQIKAKDAAGAYSSWVSFGGGVTKDFGIDTTAPTGGNVYDGDQTGVDLTFNDGSLSELSANWGGFNFDVAGAQPINRYEYSIGTTQGGTDIVGWTNNGTSTAAIEAGLTLRTSEIYYFNVRAIDNAGNVATVSSDGQFVEPELTFSVSPTEFTFDNLNAGNSYTGTDNTTLTTSTNAYGGYVIRAHAAALLEIAGGGFSIPWFDGGSYSSPSTWDGGNTGYGYTSNDPAIQGSNKFGSGTLFAPFTTITPGDIVADHTDNVTGSPIVDEPFTITHRVTTSADQPSGAYSTTIIYTATAEY